MVGFRQRPEAGSLTFLAGGVLSIALGIFILAGWPEVSPLALGVIVGVHLILGGWSILALARAAGRSLHREDRHTGPHAV